ncbi:MAG: hypothetical protein JXB50_06805 [Spirochaetes bacterium]|nr:hypothetical protein [Spirochaetota bacterium]
MQNKEILIIFYSINELNLNDIDKELYTKEKKEIFHLFFFHNKDLHFNKSIISNQVLKKLFENIEPVYTHDKVNDSIILTKTIINFNYYEFDNAVDDAYSGYLKMVKYRIDSIIETFILFNKLYSNKNLIFVFPYELIDNFNRIISENKIKLIKVSFDDKILIEYDIFYWISYFSRNDMNKPQAGNITKENIKLIFKIDNQEQ